VSTYYDACCVGVGFKARDIIESQIDTTHIIVSAHSASTVRHVWKREAGNLKDYHRQQGSNVKLFSAQRRRDTAKQLQFLELMKATFDCGRNTRQ